MGVKGLWRLLLPIGRRISIETLEGRILAIDASIWLTQFLTVAARQREQDLLGDGGSIGGGGNSKAYSSDYLVGFLRRLCKLRYQGIRPVLVFDGETPEIKRREIQNRLRRRKRKLGDSFYLGDKNGDNFHTREEEEMLEATRRMAKRILAKQLRTGQLVTTKSKEKAIKKQKTRKNTIDSAKMNAKTDAKSKASVGTVANASYAPGFYDPDATAAPENRVEEKIVSTKDPASKVGRLTDNCNRGNDNDDDHLLRDDYNTNSLQEEVNDWDTPIVIDSDTEKKPSNVRNSSTQQYKSSIKPKKRHLGSAAQKFHAGDGTEFKVESVADLPESDRKDVIEDAQKQRRLASRREFMKVASDPEGLSNCQLRNFLKSTKLNRDIAKMAQAAKAKAEDEAKMALGNGIIFEKYDNERMHSGGGRFASQKTSYSAANRHHYRSGSNNNSRNGGKRSNPGMMRMFHHKHQPKLADAKSIDNAHSDCDDEHDFRKTRNNHYLSGGIRFVNSDEEEEDDAEKYVHEEKDMSLSRYPQPHFEDGISDDFGVAIMDGSKPKRKNEKLGTGSTNEKFGGEIIEIDSSSGSDDSDFEEDRKLRFTKENTKASQELQDKALAQALQTIEDEEISRVVQEEGGAVECIEIDDSDDDNQAGSGFFPHSSSIGEPNLGVHRSQQKRDDAKLARALQEAEYCEEEDQNYGGEFRPKSSKTNIYHSMCDRRGFLRSTIDGSSKNQEANFDSYGVGGFIILKNRPNDDIKEDSVNDRELLGSTKADNDNVNHDGGLFLPTTEDNSRSKKSSSIALTPQGNDAMETDANITLGSTSLVIKECNIFSSKHSEPKASRNIFEIGEQEKVSNKSYSDLRVSHQSSDDEDEDVDWEDCISENQREEELKDEINHDCVTERKKSKSPKLDLASELHSNMVSGNVPEMPGDYNDRDTGGDKCSQSNDGIALEIAEATENNTLDDAARKSPKHSDFTDKHGIGGKENHEEEEEVDWEDGDEETGKNKPVGPGLSRKKKSTGKKSKYDSVGNDGEHEKIDANRDSKRILYEKDAARKYSKNKSKSSSNDTVIDDGENEDDDKPDTKYCSNEINVQKHTLVQLCDDTNTSNLKQTGYDDDSSDDDHDEINWEDGDHELHDGETNACEVGEVSEVLGKPALDSVYRDAQEANEKEKVKRMKEGRDKCKEDTHSKTQHAQTSKFFVAATEQLSEKNETTSVDEDLKDDHSSEWETGKSEERNVVVVADDWGRTKTQSSDEVAAALEHAQGTAANLTNWAGRAFRRAIAQHAIENGMEIPEAAKPGVLKNTRRVMDRDEPTNELKRNISSSQKTPEVNIPCRKRLMLNRTKPSDQIDNSSWLEKLDTTSMSIEDYTEAPQEAHPSNRLLDSASGGVTDEMRTEVMQLLRLFGVPYVVAPAEAEAQCVELERLGLVDGIVTEDSDAFVFGGQVIYKNIFEDKKYVEVYHAKDAGEEMNLTQDSLVALAMLLGGDYTEGVKGVGIVNGMEVLQAFDVAQGCEAGLKRFRKWLDGFDPNDMTKHHSNGENKDYGSVRSEKEQLFHRKHHTARTRWIAPKQFPDAKVLNAYLNPVVDTSKECFSWGTPDLDGLKSFCDGYMGWAAEETEKLVVPIIRQIEDSSMRQTRIDSFMRYEDGIKFAKIQSKRLRQVLGMSTKDTIASGKSRQKSFYEEPPAGNTETIQFRGAESPLSEPEKLQTEVGTISNADVIIQENTVRGIWLGDEKARKPEKPKKRNNGKRTMSLAALSSSSATTVVIASRSKTDDINRSKTNNGFLDSSVHRRFYTNNLPQKAPPAYQKQSSAILEEQNDNSSEASDSTKRNTYEVTNPSII